MKSYDFYECPLGNLLLVAHNKILCGIYFEKHKAGPDIEPDWKRTPEHFATTKRSLDRYFETGLNDRLPEFKLDGTDFQLRVWNELKKIKPGTTSTYATIAKTIGSPKASRAVGAAVGKNPISILIPCHRVVGSSGLTGFAGGIKKKEWLLDHEQNKLLVNL